MRTHLLAAAVLFGAGSAAADDFDYYVGVFSWNATWCALEGDARDAPQCDPREDIGFVLHGLWPQYEDGGWPEYCETGVRDPRRAETDAMADVFGSRGLAWHQWKKHGRCAGLDPADYFALAREIWEGVSRPQALRQLGRDVRIDPDVVEAAFLDANPALKGTGVSVNCRDGHVYEVRVCFSKALTPRACTGKVARDCRLDSALLPAMR